MAKEKEPKKPITSDQRVVARNKIAHYIGVTRTTANAIVAVAEEESLIELACCDDTAKDRKLCFTITPKEFQPKVESKSKLSDSKEK